MPFVTQEANRSKSIKDRSKNARQPALQGNMTETGHHPGRLGHKPIPHPLALHRQILTSAKGVRAIRVHDLPSIRRICKRANKCRMLSLFYIVLLDLGGEPASRRGVASSLRYLATGCRIAQASSLKKRPHYSFGS